MKPIRRLLPFAFALLAGVCRPAAAEDIDIFTALPPTAAGPAVNVLILLDNSTNWTATFGNTPGDCASTDPTPQNKTNNKYCHVMGALKAAIGALGSNVKVGLMLFKESGANGAYMRFGVRPMNPTNKAALIGLIDNLRALSSGTGGDRDGTGSNQPYGKAMFEVFKYFGGHSSPAAVSTSACSGSPCAGSPVSQTHFGPAVFQGDSGSTATADKRDWPGNTGINSGTGVAVNSAATRGAESAGSAYASATATSYTSPISDGCQKNYLIVISSGNASVGGDAGGNTGLGSSASTLLTNVGGNLATINPPGHANTLDEWARFLYATDVSPLAGQQNIVTYTVMVWDPQANGLPSNSDATGIGLLNSAANQGHGRYFDANNPTALAAGFATIFNEVQAVNSVFAAVALPVSVNVRGTNLNQVYLGVFRPDAGALPRWPGNLKQYQLNVGALNTVFLADQRNVRADNPESGFIVDDAISFWTTPNPAPAANPLSGFWSFRSNNIGNPPSGHDSPDGATVEKGGVSQRLHTLFASSQASRKIYTCLACAAGTDLSTAGASTLFNVANAGITQGLLGTTSGSERDSIINWVRGDDNTVPKENAAPPVGQTIRPTIHGDVLHSRPAVINYNRVANSEDDVVVFYGANDGLFRAVKGGKDAVPGPGTDVGGNEKWAFVAEEFLAGFKRLRDNTPAIGASAPKTYFFDGPIGVFTKDAPILPAFPQGNGRFGDTGDIVNLYIAMRRGGRTIYALDVNDPDAPKLLWKITNTTTGFSELGQTWSQPTVVSGLAGLTDPVLIFGAGYDPAVEDVDPASIDSITSDGHVCLNAGCSGSNRISRSMGRGIYVVNALTGALIWSAGKFAGATRNVADMHFAIPSDVTVIRNESGGATNRAYVGDTGGNLWRIDFGSPDGTTLPNCSTSPPPATPQPPNCTRVTKLASIANPTTAAGRRKFLFPPDVVGQTGFDAVVIGSGDREHPFDSTVTNRFYMFKDKGTDAGPATGLPATCDPTITEPPIANAACTPDPIAGLSDLTSNCLQDAAACALAIPVQVQATLKDKLGTDRGWFITLGSGEKVIGNALSIGGTTFFNTNQPSAAAGVSGTCSPNLGIARQYQVATADATATSDLNVSGGLTGADRSLVHKGGGYLPSPVHVVVMLGGKPVEALISGVQVSKPAGAPLLARLRKFWYKEVDSK